MLVRDPKLAAHACVRAAVAQAVSGTASTHDTQRKGSTFDAALSHVSETVVDPGGSASIAGNGAETAAAALGEVDSPFLSEEQVFCS